MAMFSPTTEIDFIEELKLRRWARENYVPQPKRDGSWHPIIHDEMETSRNPRLAGWRWLTVGSMTAWLMSQWPPFGRFDS